MAEVGYRLIFNTNAKYVLFKKKKGYKYYTILQLMFDTLPLKYLKLKALKSILFLSYMQIWKISIMVY